MELKKEKYSLLSPKEIKITGWIKKQLRIQANGLSGNLDKVWPSVRDSAWLGGCDEGWERVPYWLDGFIPLAYLLNDKEMIGRAKKYIDAIISRQNEDGWICPCTKEERANYDLWAALLITKVLVVYAKCSGEEDKIEKVIYSCLNQLNKFLDSVTLKQWGQTRWFEGLIAAYWLYDRVHEEWIIDYCKKLSIQGTDWDKTFNSGLLDSSKKGWNWLSHVVNLGMILKSDALMSQLNGNNPETFAKSAYKYLIEKHGMACHHFSGDECLHGTSPLSGTELCGVVEAMYSYEILFRISGDPIWLDRLEELAFNALPASISPDMWSRQYDQMTNQIKCDEMKEWIFRTNGKKGHVFGLDTNYGCCTANFNQGFPKFAWTSFLKSESEIVSCTLTPASIETKMNGEKVKITLKTLYPFDDELEYEIQTKSPVDFTFSIRIPKSAKRAYINGEEVQVGKLYSINKIWNGIEKISVKLDFDIKYEKRPSGMYTLWRGPILFVLPIDETWIPVEDGKDRIYPHCDYRVLPQSPWNYGFACDVDDIKVNRKKIGEYIFDPKLAPINLDVKMAPISWGQTDDYCNELPDSSKPIGKIVNKKLIPYGCTNLRITETYKIRKK